MFFPNKSFREFLEISPQNLIYLKTFEYTYGIYIYIKIKTNFD